MKIYKTEKEYAINEIDLTIDINNEYSNFNLTSDIVDASLTGNTKISDLKIA